MDHSTEPTNEQRRHFLRILAGLCLASEGCTWLSPQTNDFHPEEHMMNTNSNERYLRGLHKLSEIDGEAGEKVIESLQHIAPDLARYTIEYPFGDVYSRPELDLKSREIATVAALTALGNARPQLKVHLNAALNVGCTPKELVEIIIQMSVYAGFPAALNAASAAGEVFSERGVSAH